MDHIILERLANDYIKGDSLNKLNETYKLPKSTIFYNISKLNILRKQNRIHNLSNNNPILIGTFVGLWAGDGSRFKDRHQYIVKIHFDKRNELLSNFLINIIFDLFGIKSKEYLDGGNKASIKISSKFVFTFVEEYLEFSKNKSLTVNLKNNVYSYNKDFLQGFLLGLTLSDGSIANKNRIFVYSTISHSLAENVKKILTLFSYNNCRSYVSNREKYGWHDLNLIYLNRSNTDLLVKHLDYLIAIIEPDFDIINLKKVI